MGSIPVRGTNYSVVKVLVFTGLTLLLSGQRWRLMLAHGPLSLFSCELSFWYDLLSKSCRQKDDQQE